MHVFFCELLSGYAYPVMHIPFGFESEIWALIVLVTAHRLSTIILFYFFEDGRFAVIQEDEDSMPFTPYTLLVVQNGQLKKIPVMKKETAGKAKYSLANAADKVSTVELRWLEHLRDHENMFETGVVRANECYS